MSRAGGHHAETEPPRDLRPAWVTVDLDALASNLRRLRRSVGNVGILGVVKADAYGHGAVPVARTLEGEGIDWLGVAMPEEGLVLRRAEIRSPILVLGAVPEEQLDLFDRHDLTPTISSEEQLRAWTARRASRDRPLDVHLKVDTGMGRLGVPMESVPRVLETLRGSRGLRLAGLLSHLATAEEPRASRVERQEQRFRECVGYLEAEERRRVVLHLANTAGALHHPPTRHGLVRLGLGLYGYDPARRLEGLERVLSVQARLVLIREVEEGRSIGYGDRWTAPRDSRIGVVPLGYADGYHWRLGNRGRALVRGARVRVVGAVSMDMAFVDLTDVPAETGDVVRLLGTQGGETVDAWDLAERAGTIPYEILTSAGLRLPRVFLRGDRRIEVHSRHLESS